MSAKPKVADTKKGGGHGHGGHGMLAMLACCIPMVVLFVLLGFKVI